MAGRYDDYAVLTVPGLHGSGPGHWQTLWERAHPEWRRIEQRDWADPQLEKWAGRVQSAVVDAKPPVLLVAHSFGCLAVARAASLIDHRVHGALLVAPADPARFGVEALLPQHALGFPSITVASRDDPLVDMTKVRQLARQWGSSFVDIGAAGHINVATGFGAWPFGKLLLDELRLLAASEVRSPVALVA